jgi:signal transduction histidine kinase
MPPLSIADYFTILSIGAGAVIMLLSVFKTKKLQQIMVSGVNTIRWTWLSRFMVIFFAGYVASIVLIISGYEEPLLLIIGLVFLLGSCFVYVVVFSAKSDIIKMNDTNELLVQKNNELKKTNMELDEFAYRTSHDLKAPITSLKGLIRIAQLSGSQEEIYECHKMMQGRLSKLEELIRDILDLSKNSRTDIQYINTDLRSAIDHVIDIHSDGSSKKIRVEVEGPEQFIVKTDPTRIKMILGNLISNGLHYADLTKHQPFIKVKYWMEKENYIISVKDNGVGIDETYLDRIFDMFFRIAENSIGSGLGLYIVKETVERLNGKIQVKSQKCVGSEFIVTFPFLQPVIQAPQELVA